jgi:hypothetical protein
VRVLVACLLLLALVPTASAARWSTTAMPGRALGVASWQGADVRLTMPGTAWVRRPSGRVERAPKARTRIAFVSGAAVVGDDGTVLAAASSGVPSVATAGGVTVYATGNHVAARVGSGTRWSAEMPVAPATHGISYGTVALAAGGGRVCVAFLRTDAAVGSAETWFACRVRGVWRPATPLSATGHATSVPAIAVDRAGRALVLWRDLDAGRIEYVVVAPSGARAAPTALVDRGTSAAARPVAVGSFVLLYTFTTPGQPATVVRRALVRGRLGPPVQLGRVTSATAVGIGLTAAGRRAYVWLAGRRALFVRTGGSTLRLAGTDIRAGQPVVNAAADVAVPYVRAGRAGVLVYRSSMRLRVVRPPASAIAGTTVRLRLRISGALNSHRVRSTCGARTVARTATTAVVLVRVPARRDLTCTFRVAERGSSVRTSLTIRAVAGLL